MKHLEVLLPAALAIYGGYVMWNALARMTYYNYARGAPGPGFLPFWLALGLIILGLILTVQAVRSPVLREDDDSSKHALREVGFVLAALAIALLVFTWLGFIITTVVLIVVIAYRLGVRSWWVLFPVALLVSVGAYALFAWLGVDLPRGLLK